MSLRNKITHALIKAEEWIFANPKIVLVMSLVRSKVKKTSGPTAMLKLDQRSACATIPSTNPAT